MPHKLLLADDSASIRQVIELTFADEDVEVVAVGDGEQAIEAIGREAPDIVLVDASLPGTDGYGIASFVRNDRPHARIPVVLLTGAFEPLDESRAAAAGSRDVLVKPFAPRQVIDKVRELLGPAPVPPADAAAGPVAGEASGEAALAEAAPDQSRAGTLPVDTGSGETEPGASSPADEVVIAATPPGTDAPAGGVVPGAPAAATESAPAESAPAESAAAESAPAETTPAGTAAEAVPDSTAQPSLSGASVLARAFAAFLAAEQAASTPAGRVRETSGAASAPDASGPAAGGDHGPAPGAS